MSGQLEQVVTDFLAALDSLDVDAMLQGLRTTHRASTKSHAAGFVAEQTSVPTFGSWRVR